MFPRVVPTSLFNSPTSFELSLSPSQFSPDFAPHRSSFPRHTFAASSSCCCEDDHWSISQAHGWRVLGNINVFIRWNDLQ